MNFESTIRFNETIAALVQNMEMAWNNSDCDKMEELMEKNVIIYVEPVTVGKIRIAPEKIEGRDEVIKFIKKIQKNLPLRYTAEYDKSVATKNLKYKKFFYEIKAWAYFDSKVSEYGRFKEFRIGGYENVHAEKLTSLYIARNVVAHKIKSFFRDKV